MSSDVVTTGGGNMQEYKTISELALELGVTESSARRWARQFSMYLPSSKVGKAIKYEAEQARNVLHIAKVLFEEGHLAEEISATLAEKFTKTVSSELVQDDETTSAVVTGGGSISPDVLQRLIDTAIQTAIAPVIQELQEAREQLAASVQAQLEQHRITEQLQQEVTATAEEHRIREDVQEQKRRQREEERDRHLMEAIRLIQEQQQRPWWQRLLGK